MYEMYVYDPETIVPRDPNASTPPLELTTAALDGSERTFETRRCA